MIDLESILGREPRGIIGVLLKALGLMGGSPRSGAMPPTMLTGLIASDTPKRAIYRAPVVEAPKRANVPTSKPYVAPRRAAPT